MSAMSHLHPEQPVEQFRVPQDLAYNWEYDATRNKLMRLYEHAKRDQWNATDAARLVDRRRPALRAGARSWRSASSAARCGRS